MAETRVFRSRLNALPIELKEQIGEISYQRGMLASSRRNKIIEALNSFNIQYLDVGTGTNRFIIKYDGYAMKIALDNEGIADNKQEWVMSELLSPNVASAHEITKGGHLLVSSYAPAFTSYSEMSAYGNKIRSILSDWGNRFLIGDVGLNRDNFANWGLNSAGEPVCIDYAYIFPAEMGLFECICGNQNLMFTDQTYTSYKCPKCGHIYEDREIRAKISGEERAKLFKSIDGFEMDSEFQEFEIDNKYIKIDTNPDLPNDFAATRDVMQSLGKF